MLFRAVSCVLFTVFVGLGCDEGRRVEVPGPVAHDDAITANALGHLFFVDAVNNRVIRVAPR